MSGHYDESTLHEYLDNPHGHRDRVAIEAHLASCAPCRSILDELRDFEQALASNSMWELADSNRWMYEAPEEVRSAAEMLESEDAEATEELRAILSSPASFRKANVPAQPLFRTAGVVRALCTAARELRERQPMFALSVADAAANITEQLPVTRYPAVLIDDLRGMAWLERANVLRYLGRYPEALDALDLAEQSFRQTPVAPFSIALVQYLRAIIFIETERLGEALALARQSARVFRQFGEEERYVHARIVEASVLYHQNRYRDARDLYLTLVRVAKNTGEAATLASLYQNIANCALRLSDLDEAADYFSRALSLYEALGLETEKIRTRWNIGRLQIASGDVEAGMARLRDARRELEQIGARTDSALAALDLVEALLGAGGAQNAREAAHLCSGLVESFTAVGMTGNALTVLAYLREAVSTGTATPKLVREVRTYLQDHPTNGPPFFPSSLN
ncbi:MAG TPA: tetratricopeptide repeat protein [Thermoanaerobaculia bacterium]